LGCDFCHQVTYLTGKFKHLPISIHQTLQGTLSVNWAEKYSGEFICPQCNQGQISKFHYADGQSHQLKLGCNYCSLKTLLCCQVPPQFHGYRQHLVCPNPLCHQIGPDGQNLSEISRELILSFLDINQTNCNRTIREKLYNLKDFFDFFGLESLSLVRHRDIPKQTIQDVDWLDEITRQGIKQHLDKIPAPVARHYLVQEYTAARPADICQMAFDCLVEENGQWYIKFYQHKVERWHRLPAPREIRRVIEQQQQWIRKTFDSDYPYLFCHFRSIKQSSYPSFPSLKPLPNPPQVTASGNPMVRLIRLLIEQEDIRDSNGQKPYFTGKITRSSRLQEVRAKHGMEAAQLYADLYQLDVSITYRSACISSLIWI